MTEITAHSGSDSTPDNSLEFVRYALTLDCEALEFDIRRDSVDGTLFLAHDNTNIRHGEPTLAQAFKLIAAHNSMKVNCDLKEAGLERAVYDLAASFGIQNRVIYSGTVNPSVWHNDKELFSNTALYYNIELIPCSKEKRETLSAADFTGYISNECSVYGIKVINLPYSILTDDIISGFSAHGIGISAWTVNDADTQRHLLSFRITNITTRRPKDALALRASL